MAADVAREDGVEPLPSNGAAGRTSVVTANGELDMATGPALRREVERLLAEGQTTVIVDLDEVTLSRRDDAPAP